MQYNTQMLSSQEAGEGALAGSGQPCLQSCLRIHTHMQAMVQYMVCSPG